MAKRKTMIVKLFVAVLTLVKEELDGLEERAKACGASKLLYQKCG